MAVNLSPVGGVAGQFFDNNGDPLVGGKLYTYAAGTTTPQATYTSSSGATANSNPIILNAGGRVPSEIWLTDGLAYKFVLYSATDQLIGSWDNISGINSNFVNYTASQEIQTATSGQTVFTLTTMQYQPGTNSLTVYVDGVNQYGPGALYSYVETDSTTVTFNNGLHVGAEVKFTTVQQATSSATDAAQVAYQPAGSGAVTTTVQAKLRETVSVKDFGAVGDGVTDDTVAIQAAIDSGAGTIVVPDGVYITTSPIYIDGNVSLFGYGSSKSQIKKITNTVGSGSNSARSGTVTDSYAKNAILIFRHQDNSYTYNVSLKGLGLISDGYLVEYGIYAPRTTQTLLEEVLVYQCRYGWYTHDSFLTTFNEVVCNSNTVRFGGSNYGWADATPSYGFVWADDGSSSSTGTTLTATACWGRDCHYGWSIYGLQYSVLSGCGADNISFRAYRFHLSSMTLSGCGMENVFCQNSGLDIESGQTTITNFNAYGIYGSTNASSAMVFLSSANVTMTGCRFDNFVTPSSSANIAIQSNTKLVTSSVSFPTNGNTFISYSSGSRWIDLDNPIVLRNATNTAYSVGRVRDNQVQQKIGKSILSAGTVIATFTADGTASLECAVCEFTVSYSDAAFPSVAGISKFLATVYVDTAGTNYAQDVTLIGESIAGNTGGAVTPPTFAFSRVGNVWSLTMTPAHGDCTAYTITAEMQNINGVTLALA